jgi:hypothetical protein
MTMPTMELMAFILPFLYSSAAFDLQTTSIASKSIGGVFLSTEASFFAAVFLFFVPGGVTLRLPAI